MRLLRLDRSSISDVLRGLLLLHKEEEEEEEEARLGDTDADGKGDTDGGREAVMETDMRSEFRG